MDFKIRLRLMQEAGYLLKAQINGTDKSYDIGLTLESLSGDYSFNKDKLKDYNESELTYILYAPDGEKMATFQSLGKMKQYLDQYRYNSDAY